MRQLLRSITTTLCALAVLAVTGWMPVVAQTSFDRVWERSAAQGDAASAFYGTNNDTRSIAYGTVNDGQGNIVERVFVATGGNDPYEIHVLRANNGSEVGTLPGVDQLPTPSDGRKITDVGVSDDGVIIACNEVNNSFTADGVTENFQCWRWDSLADSPTQIIDYTPPDQDGDGEGDWLGRQFTVVGSAAAGDLTLLVAGTRSSVNVYRFTTSDNGQSFSADVLTRDSRPPSGNINGVAPEGPGQAPFVVNVLNVAPLRYNASGSEVAEDQGAFPAFSHSLKYFEIGGRSFYATFRWDTTGENQFASIVEVTNGFAQALPTGTTPNFGRNADGQNTNTNGTGDVDVRINEDGTATIYVLATNSGLGAYTSANPLPVEFASFDAVSTNEGVKLTWSTASETNNAGFYIERSVGEEAFTDVGFREGAGTTTETQTYRFRDTGVPFDAETIQYRLRQVDTDGTVNYSDVVTVQQRSDALQFLGSAPNPLSSSGTIRYIVPEAMNVRLAVYDMLGRQVSVLVDERQKGRQTVQVNTQGWAPGTYLVRLKAGDQTQTGRLTVVQ